MFDNDHFSGKTSSSASWMRSKYSEREKRRKEEERLAAQQDMAESLSRSQKRKGFWSQAFSNIGEFAEESNKRFLGGAIEGAANVVNWVGSGFNSEEADKRTDDFMQSTGLRNEYGLNAMEAQDAGFDPARMTAETVKNQNDSWAKAGQIAGSAQSIATDIATTVIPGMALEKYLRGTKYASRLLNAGRAGKIGGEAALSVAGGLGATAAGAVKDPASLTAEDAAMSVGIDAVLGAASPVAGKLFRVARSAKNSKQLEKVLKNEDLEDLSDETIEALNNVSKSNLSGKKYNAEVNRIINESTEALDAAKQADEMLKSPAGARLLGTGTMRTLDENDADLQRFRNSEFTDEDNVWKDNVVTTEGGQTVDINEIDRQISMNSRQIRDLEQQRMSGTPPTGVNPAEYTDDAASFTKIDEAIERLTKETEELVQQRETAATFAGGVSRELDPAKVSEQMSMLQREREGILQSMVPGDGNVPDPSDELRALEEGRYSDDLFDRPSPADPPERIISDLERLDPDDVSGVRDQLEATTFARRTIQEKIEARGLLTEEAYQQRLTELEDMYRQKEAAIAAEPSTMRQRSMMEELDLSYNEQRSALDAKYLEDGKAIQPYEDRLAELDAVEDSLFDRAEALREELWATNRGAPNEELVNQRRRELQVQKEVYDYAQKMKRNETYVKNKNADPIESENILRDAQKDGIDIKNSNDPAIQKAMDDQVDARIHANSGKNPNIINTFAGMPPRVIEGFGDAGKKVSQRIRQAIDDVTRENGKYEIKMQDWANRIGGNKERVKVAKALDGDEEALKSLNPEQLKVHDEIRKWFDDWADKLGLPHESRIKDYFPHVFNGKDMDSVNRALAYLKAGKKDGKDLTPKQIKKYTDLVSGIDMETLKYISRANVYKVKKNGFLKKRTGAMDYEYDLFGALDLYNRRGNDTTIMQPAFDEVKQLSSTFTRQQNAYLDKVIKRLKGENADWEDQLNSALANLPGLSKSDRAYNDVSRSLRSLIYDATLGANPRSAIQNFEQGSMVYAEIGEKGMMRAVGPAMKAMRKGTQELRELYEEGVLEFTREGHLKGTSSEIFKNTKDKVLWAMFRRTERWNRAVAYFGGKQNYIAKNRHLVESGKMTEEEFAKAARQAGRDIARKTNFEFSAFDIPLAMQSDMAKNAMQLQTYNVQKASELKQWIYGAEGLVRKMPDGSHQLSGEAAVRMARFVGANALWYTTVGAGIGATYQMAVPFLAEFTEGEVPRSPMTQLLVGDGKANPGLVGLVGRTADIFRGEADAGDVLDAGRAWARGAMRTLLPGGNQALKTGEGIMSVESGASTTASGNLRFYQDQDVPNVLKALVLGQYGTDAGKDWVKDGMPYVDKNQKLPGSADTGLLEYMNTLPAEKQQQYYQYFSTKGNMRKALGKAGSTRQSELVKELKDGKISVATAHRETEEWNARAIEYFQQNYGMDSIPPRLVQDFMESMIIDITSVEDAMERGPSMSALEREQYYFNADMEW